MEWRERITLDPDVLVGKLKGTRLAVEYLLAQGWTQDDIAELPC